MMISPLSTRISTWDAWDLLGHPSRLGFSRDRSPDIPLVQCFVSCWIYSAVTRMMYGSLAALLTPFSEVSPQFPTEYIRAIQVFHPSQNLPLFEFRHLAGSMHFDFLCPTLGPSPLLKIPSFR